MYRKREFADDAYFHIYNRGVDKRTIFEDDEDHYRFLHGLYEYNDKNLLAPFIRRGDNPIPVATYRSLREKINEEKDAKRERLVDILCFTLMPNHFHFVLKQLRENGISLFMRKVGMGYANYFNLKNERSGALFQGRFKAKLIKTDAQMMHLSRYIHVLNPGELVEPKIREGIVQNPTGLKGFLQNYKWSSYQDYIGQKNYSSLINKDLISGYFGNVKESETFSLSWKNDDFAQMEEVAFD